MYGQHAHVAITDGLAVALETSGIPVVSRKLVQGPVLEGSLYLGGGELVQLPHELGVALGEHGIQDAQHGGLFLPGRRAAGGAAHRMRNAAPPCGARVGVDDVRRSRSRRSASDSSSDEHILDTWLALVRPMPTPCAMLFIFLVGTPLVTVSDTSAMTARSTREYRSMRSSGT